MGPRRRRLPHGARVRAVRRTVHRHQRTASLLHPGARAQALALLHWRAAAGGSARPGPGARSRAGPAARAAGATADAARGRRVVSATDELRARVRELAADGV